jgi:uncharacterized protein YbjT (DUF2867 family)
MILVVGSTGNLGAEICHILARKGIPIRALIRSTSDPIRVERLKNYGSELVLGDLRDPASLADACQGMYAVICTASALSSYQPFRNHFETVDLEGVLNLIDVAGEAGVPHFIFISLSRNIDLESPLCNAKRAAEKYLRESGMVYTQGCCAVCGLFIIQSAGLRCYPGVGWSPGVQPETGYPDFRRGQSTEF